MDVGHAVHAVDPACGAWLLGKIVGKNESQLQIKWRDYPKVEPSWIAKENVRAPEKRRQLRREIKVDQWPSLKAPRNLQRGDSVLSVREDGTPGEPFVVEVNDGFMCEVLTTTGRVLRYEFIKETTRGTALPIQAGTSSASTQPPVTVSVFCHNFWTTAKSSDNGH
ncbi:uncharacterized protein LOC119735506 [Patiria miniata]|uniref:Chromo domain-containing protein n=1 Tax=Patiria miniata TaxID=46514 RepID=A0A914ANS8_PATMI|nr:uncharacterized protein LOC119735506 [Patiria miniata]